AHLRKAEQDVLRRAVAATRAAGDFADEERRAATAYCRAGGTIVTAAASVIAALRRRTAPIIRAMRDPETRRVIHEITRAAATPGPPIAPCGAANVVHSTAPPNLYYSFVDLARILPPTGTYRRAFTFAQLRAAGASEFDARRSVGVLSLTIYGAP